MNTAEVIKFPGTEPWQQEKQVADLENGYLRLANQIQDALCIVELSGREFRVLNAIIRLTYGWSKKEDRITNSLIADKTGLAVKHVSLAVIALNERRIIKLKRIGQTRYIGINTNLAMWANRKPNCPRCIFAFTAPEIVTQVITIPEIGDSAKPPELIPINEENHPQNQGCPSPEMGNTKDILSNTDIQKDITPIVPAGDVCKKPTEQDEEKPPEQPASQSIKTVFSHWQAEHNHLTSKLDQKRRKRINARLEEGFTVADLCKAISGAKYDAWLMGKNPSNRRYDGIETILRDAAQVEKLRDLDDNEHAKAIASGKYSATTARNLDRLQRWAGEGDSGAPF
ncbi:phage replication protein [Pectobacterium parmentieri]|uniref:replication protein n=1 Tax=Pectobacterium parmentieri TaxID=1905730 RepID=UPI0018DF5DB9|nr:replication protein [Pectobacterium parmentieri]MBI0520784.1 phage replication protein [Pectobacterium parmentieri]